MEKEEKYALFSVYNKKGLADFAKNIYLSGYKIIATEGTGVELSKNSIPFIPCQNISNNPESFDGYMKTLSFSIEAGIFFDRLKSNHLRDAKKFNVKQIDIVVCNFFPISKISKLIKNGVRKIDFGGPTMVRIAAQNFNNVLTVVDPNDYVKLAKLIDRGIISYKVKKELAIKAFEYICHFDLEIIKYLKK